MKFIFLDIDGVMRSENFNKVQSPVGKIHSFDEPAVEVLNEILEITDAEIIISSDWRNDRSLEDMRLIFEFFDVDKLPIAFTMRSRYYDEAQTMEWKSGGRAFEIKEYVDRHGLKEWVAIDDLPIHHSGHADFFDGHFVHCDGKKSTEEIKNEVIVCLNQATV